ncbi:MAG TPA: Plug domain-containing protein, partial [Gemmatimonadales bacterium]|nr:Plug domain-containing protein [Gemmatimonadales bacterium]
MAGWIGIQGQSVRRWALVWLAIAACLAALPLAAQEPQAPDSVQSDSAITLPDLTVTRAPERIARAPLAVARLDRDALSRGHSTVTLDEALPEIPGVSVANRYNFALDERISIRGFGSRASFGV